MPFNVTPTPIAVAVVPVLIPSRLCMEARLLAVRGPNDYLTFPSSTVHEGEHAEIAASRTFEN